MDYDTGNVFCANHHSIVGFDPNTGKMTTSVSLVDEGYITQEDGKFSTEVVDIQHLPDQFAVCAILRTGDVLLWHIFTNEVSWLFFI